MESQSSSSAECLAAGSTEQDRYLRPVCNPLFTFESAQRRHVRKQHPDVTDSLVHNCSASFECDVCCDVAFPHRGGLLRHHEQVHGFVPRRIRLEFSSLTDFESLKDHEEKTELVRIVVSGGTKHLASGGTKKYLVCHRSGPYVKTGKDDHSF
ncbi:uncharacterized protein LOC144094150 [Amblyomma americanum]|uniref:C2H2-type domain-containing protein n=1 Tax=Amblyomma americanum TaxID=6943 RepID=A0AAQ4EAY6_AMBAM